MFRLIAMLVLVALMLFGLYQIGKAMGWWGKKALASSAGAHRKPDVTTPLAAANGANAAPKPRSKKPAEAVWAEVLNHPAGRWLYTREDRMVRITLVGSVVAPDAVLHVERVEGNAYTDRIMHRKARVQLFTFRRDGDSCNLQSVMVKAGDAPVFELDFAHEVVMAEKVTGLPPSDDMVRRLATDLNLAVAIDDDIN